MGFQILRQVVFTCCLVLPVISQGEESTSEIKYQNGFEAMKADITNPERSFEFVQAAIEVGDLRGAIAALERILQINPGLANIQLELGVLYLRVGSPQIAKLHLESSLSAPDVPVLVRERAESLLAQSERTSSRHFFAGSTYLGGRFDTNANAAPTSRNVRVQGQNGLLDEDNTGREDFSGEFVGTIQYTYALDSQAGNRIEANFLTYNRRYNRSSEINVNTVDLDVGPRFYIGSILNPDFSIKPFLSASGLFLDDESYSRSLGGGINFRKFFSLAWFGDLTLEAADQKFYNSDQRPTSSNRSGIFYAIRTRLNYQIRPTTLLSGNVEVERRDAGANFESLNRGNLKLAVTQSYQAPFGLTRKPWSSSLSAGVRRSEYDEADVAIDPSQKRRDTRVDVIFSNNVPVTESLTLVLSAQYTNNESSLPNFEFESWGGSIGFSASY